MFCRGFSPHSRTWTDATILIGIWSPSNVLVMQSAIDGLGICQVPYLKMCYCPGEHFHNSCVKREQSDKAVSPRWPSYSLLRNPKVCQTWLTWPDWHTTMSCLSVVYSGICHAMLCTYKHLQAITQRLCEKVQDVSFPSFRREPSLFRECDNMK